ncbi:hypothetical protein Flavo103_15390 [Flavobacterium collinsii]|uniref:hypothetical protein n=1 Tax=Flavobacterium collinsii TaxID=1114861 RepID=UPI0022BA7C60|nr:hypothetical protein [Flavobacterium collinsii]GIQ58403.1 hypothetical protein Flavo103_15390 [Flavobacterium collinsii]
MKTSFRLFLLSIFYLSIFSSCENQNDNSSDLSDKNANELKVDKLYDANSNLKRDFGKALVKSLNESKMLRDLIKNESLKMFDNDYEVLYQTIKNERVEKNLTVRQLILENLGSESLLNAIETNNPLLTILVPELPENSFSAKLWDTENQIPKVAIRLTTSNDVPIINQDGSEEILGGQYVPGYPVVVLKDNERIISGNSSTSKNIKTSKIANINGVDYKFLDDCFDHAKNEKNKTNRIVPLPFLDPKLVTAFGTYFNTDGWQRDYIYYGITPDSPKGPFKYDFQETIKDFALQGDPRAAYNKIADQTGDPTLAEGGYSIAGNYKFNTGWTGGNFEFKVRIIVNGKNGVGSEIIKYFNANGNDLFDYSFVAIRKSWPAYVVYELKINFLKHMSLNIPIFNWDLDQYASSIKIDIEEIDLTETTILTESRNVEFASNFGVDVSGGYKDYVKIGLKYGTSQKVNAVSTVQRTFTQGNDLLGDVIVNFADNVIISRQPNTYATREYNSGLYSITVEPSKVQ